MRAPWPVAIACATIMTVGRLNAQSTPVDPTAALLADIIRINTSNPPGRTQALAELLGARFRAAGFTVEIFPTPDSAKVHFIARLKGDGTKPNDLGFTPLRQLALYFYTHVSK